MCSKDMSKKIRTQNFFDVNRDLKVAYNTKPILNIL